MTGAGWFHVGSAILTTGGESGPAVPGDPTGALEGAAAEVAAEEGAAFAGGGAPEEALGAAARLELDDLLDDLVASRKPAGHLGLAVQAGPGCDRLGRLLAVD